LSRVAGVLHDSPVRSFRAVSVFIDDVSLSCAQGGACAVGDTGPGGGKVFSVSSSGSYLEAAPADLGAFNWATAVQQASAYRGGGLSDWRLPTQDELQMLQWQQRIAGGFSDGTYFYWSSTEYDALNAWAMVFNSNNPFGLNKTYLSRARPIRAG